MAEVAAPHLVAPGGQHPAGCPLESTLHQAPGGVPPSSLLRPALVSLCVGSLLTVAEFSLAAFAWTWVRSPRFRVHASLARRLLPRVLAALLRLAWVASQGGSAPPHAQAPGTSLPGMAVASFIWTSLLFLLPMPYHLPCTLVEAGLIYHASAPFASAPAAAAAARQLLLAVSASNLLAFAIQWAMVSQQRGQQQQQDARFRADARLRSSKKAAALAGDDSPVMASSPPGLSAPCSDLKVDVQGGGAGKAAALQPAAAAADDAALGSRKAALLLKQQQHPTQQQEEGARSAAQAMVDDLRTSLATLRPPGSEGAEVARFQTVQHAAAAFSYSVAAAMAAATAAEPGGALAADFVAYKGMCRIQPCGIKVLTAGHQSFQAVSSLLSSTFASAGTAHAAALAGSCPAVASTCVAGCVQLLGSVITAAPWEAGSDADGSCLAAPGGGPGLAAALMSSLHQPLRQLSAVLGMPMPDVLVSAAGQVLGAAGGSAVEGASAVDGGCGGGGGARVGLLACQPPCLVAGAATVLRLLVRVTGGAAAAGLARLVVFGTGGEVLVDEAVGRLVTAGDCTSSPGDDSILSISLPAVSAGGSGVAHVCLLLEGGRMQVAQPMPVLPPAAAAELNLHWAQAIAAVAAADMGATSRLVPGLGGSASSSGSGASITVSGAGGSSIIAGVEGALPGVRSQHLAAAWQLHMAPLLLDLAFALSPATHQQHQAAAAALAAVPLQQQQCVVSANVLQHLARLGMWALAEHVVTCTLGRQGLPDDRMGSSLAAALRHVAAGVQVAVGNAVVALGGAARDGGRAAGRALSRGGSRSGSRSSSRSSLQLCGEFGPSAGDSDGKGMAASAASCCLSDDCTCAASIPHGNAHHDQQAKPPAAAAAGARSAQRRLWDASCRQAAGWAHALLCGVLACQVLHSLLAAAQAHGSLALGALDHLPLAAAALLFCHARLGPRRPAFVAAWSCTHLAVHLLLALCPQTCATPLPPLLARTYPPGAPSKMCANLVIALGATLTASVQGVPRAVVVAH